MTDLCHIMKKCGSDKGLGWHNYTEYYESMFSKFRNDYINVFEMGIGSTDPKIPSNMGPLGNPGASLRGWEEYFPNAKIYGADIDEKILFETDRIKTFYCDQTNPDSIMAMWSKMDDIKFDIIIDDGLHTFRGGKIFYDNSFHMLKSGGIYIIEDVLPTEQPFYTTEAFPDSTILDLPNPLNRWDNRLLVIHKKL